MFAEGFKSELLHGNTHTKFKPIEVTSLAHTHTPPIPHPTQSCKKSIRVHHLHMFADNTKLCLKKRKKEKPQVAEQLRNS